jgi:hypothetical protein
VKLASAALAVALATALGACHEVDRTNAWELPSGKQVTIIGVDKLYSGAVSDWALVVSYESAVPLDQDDALRREVDDVWAVFKNKVDRARVNYAIVSPNAPTSSGVVTSRRSVSYLFTRAASGRWTAGAPMPVDARNPTHKADS